MAINFDLLRSMQTGSSAGSYPNGISPNSLMTDNRPPQGLFNPNYSLTAGRIPNSDTSSFGANTLMNNALGIDLNSQYAGLQNLNLPGRANNNQDSGFSLGSLFSTEGFAAGGAALKGFGALANAYVQNKAVKESEKRLKFDREAFATNVGLQKKTINNKYLIDNDFRRLTHLNPTQTPLLT